MLVTVEDADNYFYSSLFNDTWAACDNKQAALCTAEKLIRTLPFVAPVPSELMIAAICEQALWIYIFIQNNGEEAFLRATDPTVQSLSLGDASLTYNTARTSPSAMLAPAAAQLLLGWIRVGFNISNPKFVEEG